MFSFFDRLSTGWTAAKACVDVLRRDKTLIVFPFLSGLSGLIVLASFAIPLAIVKPAFLKALMNEGADVHQVPPWFWAVLFVFYFVNYFVIYFFNSALVYLRPVALPRRTGDGQRGLAGGEPPVTGVIGLVAGLGHGRVDAQADRKRQREVRRLRGRAVGRGLVGHDLFCRAGVGRRGRRADDGDPAIVEGADQDLGRIDRRPHWRRLGAACRFGFWVSYWSFSGHFWR